MGGAREGCWAEWGQERQSPTQEGRPDRSNLDTDSPLRLSPSREPWEGGQACVFCGTRRQNESPLLGDSRRQLLTGGRKPALPSNGPMTHVYSSSAVTQQHLASRSPSLFEMLLLFGPGTGSLPSFCLAAPPTLLGSDTPGPPLPARGRRERVMARPGVVLSCEEGSDGCRKDQVSPFCS